MTAIIYEIKHNSALCQVGQLSRSFNVAHILQALLILWSVISSAQKILINILLLSSIHTHWNISCWFLLLLFFWVNMDFRD